jgi:short-subunit dehydrogenase involved in D-alanine esterification of teichoic acids
MEPRHESALAITIFIPGATSGIGLGLARRLAAAGN